MPSSESICRLPILLLFLALVSGVAGAQPFDVDTLLYSGHPDNRINLVIMGDGYQASELDTFIRDCNRFVDRLLQTKPFSSYKRYLNVFAVRVISNQSGASHPGTAGDEGSGGSQPVIQVDNYFGSTFDYGGIHRLLSITRYDRAAMILATHFPAYDQAYILVNSPYYGGSGGAFAAGSTHEFSSEIALHELGHSFSGLADEYYAGDGYAREATNMTRETDPARVRWRAWLGEGDVGIYQHCCGGNAALWHKPHKQCKMEVLNNDFCPVCTEETVEQIHQLVRPVDGYQPVESEVTENLFPRTFALDLVKPEPNTLHVEWWLNGSMIGVDLDSVALAGTDLLEGANRLTATIIDTTRLTRSELHRTEHYHRVEWIIQYSPHSSVVRSSLSRLSLEVYPNPSSGECRLEYRLDQPANVSAEVVNAIGATVWSQSGQLQEGGEHHRMIDLSSYPDGLYSIRLTVNGVPLRQNVLKMN